MRKKKSRPSNQKSRTIKLPNVWEWAFQLMPSWIRPLILFIVVVVLIAVFALNSVKTFKEVQNFYDPTPIVRALWSDPVTIHIMREYKFTSGCPDNAFLVNIEDISRILGLSSIDERTAQLEEYGSPITPASLTYTVFHEYRTEFDSLSINSINLRIEEYRPITKQTGIVFEPNTCTSQLLPSALIGYLLIDPLRKEYDVLNPRVTSPNVNRLEVPYSIGTQEGLGIEVNSLKPGFYRLGVHIKYSINGKTPQTDTLLFKMAVPDMNSVKGLYFIEWDGSLTGPVDPSVFAGEFNTTSRDQYLKIEYIPNGETVEGMKGTYTYIVNMGDDIDLTGWKLSKKSGEIYFIFPKFILNAGAGVRVWRGEGTDTNKDLFGAQNITFTSSDEKVLVIQDLFDNSVAYAWSWSDDGSTAIHPVSP